MKERATRRLDRGWTVGIVDADAAAPLRSGDEVDAPVPGVVHHALVAAGYDVDPDVGDVEEAQRWVGMSDWMWRRRLDAADVPTGTGLDDVLEVEFASIDTIGTIRIDGVDVQQVELMSSDPTLMAAARQLRQHIRAGVLHLGCACEIVLEYQVPPPGSFLSESADVISGGKTCADDFDEAAAREGVQRELATDRTEAGGGAAILLDDQQIEVIKMCDADVPDRRRLGHYTGHNWEKFLVNVKLDIEEGNLESLQKRLE